MFGNTFGWIVSGIIAVVSVFVGAKLIQMSQPTPPSGWVQTTVKPLDLSEVAKPALPPMDNLKDDAGTLYRHAIADFRSHKSSYDEVLASKDFSVSNVAPLVALNDLILAGNCEAMDFFKSKPDELVGFDSTIPELDDLEELSRLVEQVVLQAKFDKQYDVARVYAFAISAMGYHLYKERIAYIELSSAENFMGTGCAMLKEIALAEQKDDKADAAEKLQIQQAFDTARREEYDTKIQPVAQVIGGLGDAILLQHSGDMFELAGDPQADRVWRVEAIRKIGRMQFNAISMADQLKAKKFLPALATDSTQDSVIRVAAAKARDMTPYENQSLR